MEAPVPPGCCSLPSERLLNEFGVRTLKDCAADLMMLKIEVDREDVGCWMAEIRALPGVLAYGATLIESRHMVELLASRMIADRIENGEPSPIEKNRLFVSP